MNRFIVLMMMCLTCSMSLAQITNRDIIFDNVDDLSTIGLLDINGDHRLDLIGEGYSLSGVQTFFHTEAYGFTSTGRLKINMGQSDFERGHFQFVDVDNDNDQDLLFVDGCSGCPVQGINLYENVDGYSFEFRYQIVDRFLGYGSPEFVISDVDQDGDQDVVMSYKDFSDIEILLLENKQSSFSVTTIDDMEDVSIYLSFASDLDADGDEEVIFLGDNKIFVYINEAGQFEEPDEFPGGNAFAHFKDITGDGVLDIYYKLGTCLYVVPAIVGGFGDRISYHCGASSDTDYYLDDHDADGDLDIYHGNAVASGVYYKEKVGDQFAASKKLSDTGYQIKGIEAFDPNGDGLADLLILGDDGYMGILERLDSQTMGLTHTLASYLEPRHIDSYQIDADPDPELLVFYDDWLGYMNPKSTADQTITTLLNSSLRIQDAGFSDLDGDQDQDMIVLYLTDVSPDPDTALVWMKNNGNGFDTPEVILFDFHDGGSVKAHDFDHDGDQDLAVFSTFDQGIVLLNDGQGTFTEGQSLPASAYDAFIKDVNLDGWADMVSWHSNDGVFYYRNKRDGGFFTAVKIGNGPFPAYCDAGDFDGFGQLEILVSDVADGLTVYFNPGGNAWFEIMNQPLYYSAALAVDLFQEGHAGILSGNSLRHYRSNAILQFELLDKYVDTCLYSSMHLADFDGSGKKDLVGYDGTLYLHRDVEITDDIDMDGFGGGEDCDALNPDVFPGAEEVANNIIDENCDGNYLYIDDDDDGYYSDTDCNDMDPDIHPDAIEIPLNGIDENCDGLDDFQDIDMDGYSADEDCNDGNAGIHPGAEDIPGNQVDEDCSGTPAASWLQGFVKTSLENVILDVGVADLTGDGIAEIIVANDETALWVSFLSMNNHNILAHDEGANFSHIVAGDVDMDGDQDIVVFENVSQQFLLMLNNGSGTFSGPVAFGNAGGFTIDLEAGDIDHDGLVDFVAAVSSGSHFDIIIFYGDGQAQFEKTVAVSQVNKLKDIYLYDIDLDGDLDIFVASDNTTRGIHWYRNLDGRMFSDRLVICGHCDHVTTCLIMDYDHDGKSELIGSVYSGGSTDPEAVNGLQAYEWNGVEWTKEELVAPFGSGNIAAGDMNMDCKLDLVGVDRFQQKVSVYYNKPTLPFSTEALNFNAIHYDFAIADLNGDHFPEIVFGQTTNDLMVVVNGHEARDFDQDGVATQLDCDDCDPAIYPGAGEILNNQIDEDCDGLDLTTNVFQPLESSFNIYPNPTDGEVHIYPKNILVPFTTSCYTMYGEKVFESYNQNIIDLSSLPSGIYFLSIMEANSMNRTNIKIVLNH